MEVYKNTLVNTLDYSFSNVFFKGLNIQLKHDVIVIPNFDNKNTVEIQTEGRVEDSDANMNKYYLSKLKNIFVYRDKYLMTKAHITGTVVFGIKKDNRWIFGVDDGTEVVNCILWINSNKYKDTGLTQYLKEGNLNMGDNITVLGQLESFALEIQLNVQKFKILEHDDEVFKFYYQTIQTQKRWFNPFSKGQINSYYRALSCLDSDAPDIVELLTNLNNEHSDYVTTEQKVSYTQTDIDEEKDKENQSLAKIAGLNPEVIDMIIRNRKEGPLEAETIKFGGPSILKEAEEHDQENKYYSRNVRLFNESVIIQKLTGSILIKIDSILNNIAASNKITRTIDGKVYDFYKLKLSSDFVNNSSITEVIDKEAEMHPEFKKMTAKEVILKCLQELENEGYIQRENDTSDDVVYFTDKRKDLETFIIDTIKEAGRSGIKFDHLCNKVKSDLSKFYNMETVLYSINELYQQSLIYEISHHTYASAEIDDM